MPAQEQAGWAEKILALRPRVRSFVNSRTGLTLPTYTDEITDEILATASLKINGLRNELGFDSWFWKVAENIVTDYVREQPQRALPRAVRDRHPEEDKKNLFERPTLGTNPEYLMLLNEKSQILKEAIAELPPQYSQVLNLHYFDELKLEDMAPRLGLTEGGVKKRLFVARDLLLKKLGSCKYKGVIR